MLKYRDLGAKEEAEMDYLLCLNQSIFTLISIKLSTGNPSVKALVEQAVSLIKDSRPDLALEPIGVISALLKDVDKNMYGAVLNAKKNVTKAYQTDIACIELLSDEDN